MKKELFKKGDVVKLKSGSTKMTVRIADGWIVCDWFCGCTKQINHFNPEELKKA
jgi:uncharacterized protein YodC (DUF2158 family)